MKIFGIDTASAATLDSSLAAAGHKTTVVGATGSGLGWLLSSEFGVAIGILAAIAGLATNFYFSRKRDKREAAEHELRMRELRAEIGQVEFQSGVC